MAFSTHIGGSQPGSSGGGGGSGTVTKIVAGPGLAGGTITAAGTLSIATMAASTLLGNPTAGTAVPTAVAIGANLTLTAGGTLNATGISAASFAALDLSTLPTSNPGGGKPWLNGGVMQVGA